MIDPQPQIDFFISYTLADEAWAEWVTDQLEGEGYRVLVQALDFRPGKNFVLEMHRGSTARHTLALLSPAYMQREFPAAEWAAAFAQDPQGQLRRLIPVRIEHCTLDGLLAPIIYIDLVAKEEDEARRLLLEGITPGRAPRPAPAAFPPRRISVRRATTTTASVSNVVPPSRVRDRRGEEAALRAGLTAQRAPGPASIVLTGGRGHGKSTLARAYAQAISAERKVVWEVSGKDVLAITEGLASLGQRLGLPDSSDNHIVAAQAAQRWLASNDAWLLLVDAAGPAEHVRTVLPATGGGEIVITSADPSWDSAQTLEVGPLPLEDSIEMLLDDSESHDRAGAEKVAEAVNCSPLLLRLAASLCRAQPDDLEAVAYRLGGPTNEG